MSQPAMYEASVPVFVQMLNAIGGLLDKAEKHCTEKKIDPNILVNGRLFPDMFHMARQVQLATDFAKGASARLAGVDVPPYEDHEKTFGELRARLKKTIEFLKSLKPEQFKGAETRDVAIKIGGKPVTFKGQPYLFHFALPNFYFHATATYAILRNNGVEIGKRDYMGQVPGL